MHDWWEIHYFSDLLQTGSDDPDGDGLSNAAEYALGTDPTEDDAGSVPAVSLACLLLLAVITGMLGVTSMRIGSGARGQ